MNRLNRPIQTLLRTALVSALGALALASDHREAPLIRSDAAADIADLYAFVSPSDPGKLVVALTVNPFSVPSEAVTFHFSPNVRYRIGFDTNGNFVANRYVTMSFFGDGAGQTFVATLPDGSVVSGSVTAPTEDALPNPRIVNSGPGGAQIFAGPADDPFFFDVVGFNRFLSGSGSFNGNDGFAGFNVSAIVVEFPLSQLQMSGSKLQVWGETQRREVTLRRSSQGLLETSLGAWQQVDRVGVPAINTALITPDLKDLYNIGAPINDRRDFGATFAASLASLGTSPPNIAILASVAIPDTLKIDLNQPIGFPNGRDLDDDVIDTILFFVFNQVAVSDGVDLNDVPFQPAFPYLGLPTQAP